MYKITYNNYNSILKSSGFIHRKFASKPKVKDANYQYLQRSKVPTFHFQKSLPRLPIPQLEKTGERYLNALRPLLTAEQLAQAESNTENFISNIGKSLQEKLLKKDKQNRHTSYISEYWFDLYLRDRQPLPLNYNPIVVFQNDSRKDYNDQLLRSANLLISAVRFMMSLRDRVLEPEVYHMNPKKSNTELFRTVTGMLPEALSWYGAYLFKAFPLDMSQFDGLFGATRIPVQGKDRILRDPSSKHVLVQRRGHFYVFDVIDADGNILSPTEILAHLAYILKEPIETATHPIGVLTTQNRDVWAADRNHLNNTGNRDVLKLIDSAIFNLVLDDEILGDDKNKLLRHYLHSDGVNRWFDKSFSLIVTGDGVAGINFEHSWGDGVAVLRFFQDVYAETTREPCLGTDSQPHGNVNVRKLEFSLDEKSKHSIERAKATYDKWCASLSVDYILYEELTKEACKKHKVSPDCIMQLGFQAAHHLLRGSFVGTYESCSTSAFRHGRTETMRPCTLHTKEFCERLHSNKTSKDELRSLMERCSKSHTQLVKEAAMGQGFDRHLFALRKIAEENSIHDAARLFESHEFKFLNQSVLSTSTLSSPAVMAGGFGPVVDEGFGIGYSAFADKLGAAVTSYRPHNDSTHFIQALHQSFIDIRNLLTNG